MAFLLSGCALGRGIIRTKSAHVVGVPDAGKPATLSSGETKRTLEIPAQSEIVVARVEASATTPATETTTFKIPAATAYVETAARVDANTGTVDTTVRKAQIDAQERRWLIWTAIGAAIAGVAMRAVLSQWPALSNGAFVLSGLAFAAWKISEIPTWLVFSVVAVVVCLVLGYKKAEWDANGDNIPDFLQRK